MKLRLIGAPDLVRAFAARLASLGVHGREYPSRYSDREIRWYADIDDRAFAATVPPPEQPPPDTLPPPKRKPRTRRS